MEIEKRKKDHVELALKEEMQYKISTMFEEVTFIHNSLPEINFNEIDCSVNFLGYKLNMPLIIEGMTGGFKEAKKINRDLAEFAEKKGIGFGLGSQRAMLENAELKETYYVRDIAHSIPIIANIGAIQLKRYNLKRIEEIVNEVEADALAIHLNPLQEIIQPEGDKDFCGVLEKIEEVRENLNVPIIVKETGAGISKEVAKKLKKIKVNYVDVSGAGGTCWSLIEYARGGKIKGFENWGIPTAASIIYTSKIIKTIASGGIRSGIDIAKSIALGAELAGAAYPFLKAYREGKLNEMFEEWEGQLKISMFLTGSKNIRELRRAKIVIGSKLKEFII